MKIEYKPIGIIHTPHTDPKGMPIQPAGAKGIAGTIELFDMFADGVRDLNGFSHIILLYHFHESRGYDLEVVPFLDNRPHGVFATRAPKRPNPIGLSIVRLKKVAGRMLHVEDIDVLNNTPLLDIKPYVPDFDAPDQAKTGWLEKINQEKISKKTSDDRFTDK